MESTTRSLKPNVNIKVSAATFCKRIKKKKKNEDLMPCIVRFKVSAEIMKIFKNFQFRDSSSA